MVFARSRQKEGDFPEARALQIKCRMRCTATVVFAVARTDILVRIVVNGTQKDENFL